MFMAGYFQWMKQLLTRPVMVLFISSLHTITNNLALFGMWFAFSPAINEYFIIQ